MSLKAGIIGMPNVGKSTLFNSLTNSNVEAANYPFATIEPNHGIVKVFDERLTKLASLINPDKITPAVCHFTDIAGLVKGASKGEGLGNQFLTNIRETDAICHVIRCFKDKNITHVNSSIDPVCDCNIINTELFLSDLQTMEKKISKIKGLAKSGKPEYIEELRICEKVVSFLEKEYFISKMDFEGEKEWGIIKECNLLTIKPIIYIANIDDEDISNPENNENFNNLKKFIGEKKIIIPIAINIEYEISKLDNEEKKLFLQEMNIKISGLDYLIKTTYDTLGIQTFFTFGKSETKAWSFYKNMTTKECAGIIHSDIEKWFIKAEIIEWDELYKYGTELKAKENGKIRIEGKDYLMQDGDVVYFRFNNLKK